MNTSMNYLMLQSIVGSNAERIAFIDFKLRFTGILKRSDLLEEFGLSDASASKLIAQYSELRPDNLGYDRSQKVNAIKIESYQPLIQISVNTALGMLAHGFNKNKLSHSPFLPYSRIGVIPDQIDINDVATVTRAMFNLHAVNCAYLSANSEKHDPRYLVPLTILSDGKNWIFRAYDRSEKEKYAFKNFNFSRVDKVENIIGEAKSQLGYESLTQDNHWNLSLPVRLKVHPNLSEKAKASLRGDYGMKPDQDELIITEKAAFIWFITKQWNIDTSESISDKKYFKFLLKNREMLLDYI
jgi:hypothetical protein